MRRESEIRLKLFDFSTDIDGVYELLSSDDQFLFSTMTPIRTKNEFVDWLQDRLCSDFHDFRVIYYRDDLVGVAYNYEFKLKHGHTN